MKHFKTLFFAGLLALAAIFLATSGEGQTKPVRVAPPWPSVWVKKCAPEATGRS